MKRFLAILLLFPLVALGQPSSNTFSEVNITTGLTINGTRQTGWPSGAIVGTVSNAVASAGLLAVDSTKTNGIAATAAHITNAWGIFDGTGKYIGGDALLHAVFNGTAGTVLNSGTPIASSIPIYSDTTGTNIGPSKVTVSALTNLLTGTVTSSNLTSGTLVGVGTAGLHQNATLANVTNAMGIFTGSTANFLRADGTMAAPGGGLANTVLGPGSATTAHAVMSFSDTTGTNAEQNAGITTSGGASLTASSFTATGDLTPSSGLGFFGNLYTATNINPSSLLSLNTFQWRKSQADMLLQSNRVHKVLFITDSWGSYPPNGGTVGPVTNYVTVLQNALKSQYGDAGSCVSVSVYNSLWNHGPNSMLMYTNGGDGSSFTISQDYIVNENTNGTPAPYYLVTNPVPSVSWKFYFDNHFSLHGNSMVFKTNGVAFGSPPQHWRVSDLHGYVSHCRCNQYG